jgi:hypothetical protein
LLVHFALSSEGSQFEGGLELDVAGDEVAFVQLIVAQVLLVHTVQFALVNHDVLTVEYVADVLLG